jgi:hypothetical protein
LPLSGHKICPFWALTRLHPDIQLPPATSALSYPTKCLWLTQRLSLTWRFPTQHTHSFTFSLLFSYISKTAPFHSHPKYLFLSPTGSLDGHVGVQQFHSVWQESQWELRSTLPLPSCSL